MKTIKSHTDIKQSKKLAEILSLTTADEFWEYHNKWESEGDEWEGYGDYPRAEPYLEYTRKENEWKEDKSDVPCWSLAALLGVLPNYHLQTQDNGVGIMCSCKKGHVQIIEASNPIDACYKMILKLNKLNLL